MSEVPFDTYNNSVGAQQKEAAWIDTSFDTDNPNGLSDEELGIKEEPVVWMIEFVENGVETIHFVFVEPEGQYKDCSTPLYRKTEKKALK